MRLTVASAAAVLLGSGAEAAMAVSKPPAMRSRRNVLAAAAAAAIAAPAAAIAAESPVIITGVIECAPESLLLDPDYEPDDAALYITIKRGGRVSNGLDLARGNVRGEDAAPAAL